MVCLSWEESDYTILHRCIIHRVCTHTHVLTEYNHCRVDYADILPELFVEVADPEPPCGRGLFSLLFSSNYHSVIDREELCKFTVYSTVQGCSKRSG